MEYTAKERTIFVSSVPSSTTEAQFAEFFSAIGQVLQIRLAGDTEYPTRFGFVEFSSPHEAREALGMSGFDLNGKRIKIIMSKTPIQPGSGVKPASASSISPLAAQPAATGGAPGVSSANQVERTIYISGIDQRITEEQVLKMFEFWGPIRSFRLCGGGDPTDATASKFAFIEYEEVFSADMAKGFSGTTVGNFTITVKNSRTPIKGNAIPPSNPEFEPLLKRTVFIANLDVKLQEHEIRAFFSSCCGPFRKFNLAGDTDHPARFAFIEFETEQAATLAISLNGTYLGDLALKIRQSRTPMFVSPEKRSPMDDMLAQAGVTLRASATTGAVVGQQQQQDLSSNRAGLLPPPFEAQQLQQQSYQAIPIGAYAPHPYESYYAAVPQQFVATAPGAQYFQAAPYQYPTEAFGVPAGYAVATFAGMPDPTVQWTPVQGLPVMQQVVPASLGPQPQLETTDSAGKKRGRSEEEGIESKRQRPDGN